ncbi:unnamed protein product [Zymoseptoria tritici ST99CH_1A5]|uniref:Uncharacterized protein n=1 Tax=Zymoseptoria tritici ST99CH_1A5 TaxID=1276529 RepID=A0A1Y6LKQ4_ZYMTR|nr:unnamed protein product [Zymoseptoria tritici ST99CH_1A5]
MADLFDVDHVTAAPAQNKHEAQVSGELAVVEIQPFRLLDLPDELWVRIGKMVIDDAPGVTTPDNMSDVFASIVDSIARPSPIPADYPRDAYLNEIQSKVDQYRNEVLPGHFPPLPAITQTNFALRNELLVYYYHTKINLTFTWHDLRSTRRLCAWLGKTDPQRRRMMRGVCIIGLAGFDCAKDRALALRSAKEYWHVCAFRVRLGKLKSNVEGHTYLEYLRSELGLKFEVVGQTEYEAAPEYREWKGTIAFK